MRVLIINKSDTTGGAAIVSRRLMEALRQQGVDARMLVCEKLTDSAYIDLAATPSKIRRKFLIERIRIFLSNGLSRKTLFKIDTGSEGLPLWKHPRVRGADAIILGWVNQGMLSLKGVRKILKLKKPVVWTMHDMWNMTGICHHSGSCNHYLRHCGSCPLLSSHSDTINIRRDLSTKVWKRKLKIYSNSKLMRWLAFVAVSNWLKDKSFKSALLHDRRVELIPNPFNMPVLPLRPDYRGGKTRILFGAARIDDPIKGLDTFKECTRILKEDFPEIADDLEVAFFGGIKDPKALKGFQLPVVNLGVLKDDKDVIQAYLDSDILVSASSYETLPGTLVEAQAYGCVPVSFNQGGQGDIISHHSTGYLASYDMNPQTRAENLARGIAWAFSIVKNPQKIREIRQKMKESVAEKFAFPLIASRYIELINSLASKK